MIEPFPLASPFPFPDLSSSFFFLLFWLSPSTAVGKSPVVSRLTFLFGRLASAENSFLQVLLSNLRRRCLRWLLSERGRGGALLR